MTQAFPLFWNRTPRNRSQIFERLGNAALVLLLIVCIVVAGCSFASFAAAAEADIPVVLQMITNITNVVAPGVSAEITAAGGLALASLAILCGTPAIGATVCDPTSLIGQYQVATDSGTKTTLLQKIQAALVAVNSQVGNMLALAKGLPTSVGAAIVTAVGIALSTVTLLLTLIPIGIAKLTGSLTVTAASKAQYPPSAKTLKKQFNAAISVQYPGAVVR